MELGNLPVIDWEQANKLVGNRPDLAKEMLALFIQSLPADIAAINRSYKAQRYPDVLHHVHKLHGALCYCGLPRLKTVVSHLETELKNNIMDSLPALMATLELEVNSVLESYFRQHA